MSKAYDQFKRLLVASVSNVAQSFYDSYVEKNTTLRVKAGVKCFVIRRQVRKCCDWCASLAGIYEKGKEPADVYKRHENCKCMVTFKSEKGTYTDVWSKKKFQTQKEARFAREKEIIKENQSQKLFRAKKFKDIEALKIQSSSSILSLKGHEEILEYFNKQFNVSVEGFDDLPLEKIKMVLAGFDDLIKEFPAASKKLYRIIYNSKMKNYGSYLAGVSQVGRIGLGDYGTGIHEAAHALDANSGFTNSKKIVEQAFKNLRIRKNSKAYINLVVQTTGLPKEKRETEIFAYSLETEMGNASNVLSKEVFKLAKEMTWI